MSLRKPPTRFVIPKHFPGFSLCLQSLASSFRHGAALGLFLALGLHAFADPQITEFMASNKTTLKDADGDYSDWIEIFNPDATAVDLTGWSLTDNAKKKTKWQFPAKSLPAGGYLVVFASSKDRRDPTAELHTNFGLDADGEYLALVKPDGATIITEFAPTFPPQGADISYGITQPTSASETPQYGYFGKATPGKRNGDASKLVLLERVSFSPAGGIFTGTATLTLDGAVAGETIRYVSTAASAAGAESADPTATSPEYTEPRTLTDSVIVRAAVFSADGTRHGAFVSAHFLKLDATSGARLDTFSSQLPVIVLDDHGLGALVKDDIDHPAWMYRFPAVASGAVTFAATADTSGPITMSVRGSSSADFPKKSYKFTFVDALGKDLARALIPDDSFSDWNLVGPTIYDRAFIRNAYVYALSNRMGRWAPRTQLAEVFFNSNGGALDAGDYAGVYVLTDKIEAAPARIAVTPVSASDLDAAAITGGYLLKVDAVDPEKYSWTTTHGFPGLNAAVIMVESPKAAKLPDAQRNYIRGYVQQMEDALYADQANGWVARSYLNYIDLPSWVDFHLLNVLVKNVDAFWRSTYFSKDRGGKIVAGPVWDFDRSLGSYDGRDGAWDTWDPSDQGGTSVDYWTFAWWGLLADDPEFIQTWVDRWQTLRRNEFSDSNLVALADSLAAEIGPAAAARDAQRWSEDVSLYGSYAAEIAHLEDWITHRAGWIDQQFVAAPTLTENPDDTVTLTPTAGTRLVYTLDGSDPRSFGGAIAASALTSETPVTVAGSAGVRARSFSSAAVTFPGSPWSSAVAGARFTVLPAIVPPASRLVNLASRGSVLSGENIVIAGVVVNDASEKRFLARAIGPTLGSQGVAAPLADPSLRIVRSDGVEMARNDGWENGPDAADLPGLANTVGAFPLEAGSRDAALVARLPAGVYSLLVSSATDRTGIGMVELYELDHDGHAVNLSARGLVQPGEGVLIGGFVIAGSAPKRVLVRAVGPTLGAMGVAHPLGDPVLTLHAGSRTVASNDDWGSGDRTTLVDAATTSGAFTLPDGSKDAAVVTTLGAGVYSVVVSGKGADEGVALVEIYELP